VLLRGKALAAPLGTWARSGAFFFLATDSAIAK